MATDSNTGGWGPDNTWPPTATTDTLCPTGGTGGLTITTPELQSIYIAPTDYAEIDWDSIEDLNDLILVLKECMNTHIPISSIPEDKRHMFKISVSNKDPDEIVRLRDEGWQFKE